MREIYHLGRVDDCCTEYGFRKGYRFRENYYGDQESEEEIRRFNQPRRPHLHNPLALARGTVIGYAYARAGKVKPYKTPADLVRTCCAGYGFHQGFDVGHGVFFENATQAQRKRYLDAYRKERFWEFC